MVNTKDLRDMFDELTKQAGKRASHALDDVSIGRQSGTPGLLIFCIGLGFGALIGLVAAFLATPYNGKQVRAKITERVDELRKQREVARESNGHPYEVPAAATFERG
jgi:hypothetical protein